MYQVFAAWASVTSIHEPDRAHKRYIDLYVLLLLHSAGFDALIQASNTNGMGSKRGG